MDSALCASMDVIECNMPCDNSLIFHIYIIIRKYYHTYFELIHVFYSWIWNNV